MTSKTTDYTAQAWAQVPGLPEIERALAALAEITIAPVTPAAQISASVTDRLVAGEKLTGAAIVAEMTAADTAHRSTEMAAAAVQNARGQLTSQRTNLQASGASTALSWLHQQLRDMVDDIRPAVAALDGLATTDEVMRAGSAKVTAWTTLADAAANYTRLRAAQQRITVAGYGAHDPDERPRAVRDVHRFGLFRDQRHTDPALIAEVDGTPPTIRLDNTGDDAPPWPSDPAEFLRWAVEHDLEPWVPTLAELRAEAAAHGDDVHTAQAERSGYQLDPAAQERAAERHARRVDVGRRSHDAHRANDIPGRTPGAGRLTTL